MEKVEIRKIIEDIIITQFLNSEMDIVHEEDVTFMELILKQKKRRMKSMTDGEFVLDNKKKVVVRKRISYLNKGDKVWIVSSDGYLLHTDVVRAERGRSYVDIDGILYWKRGLDGKHRNRNNYMQFAMTPEDGKKYVVYYPEGFKDNDL